VRRNFLVVAANAPAREALATGLRAAGFAVTRASNGAEAERVAQSVSIDAVIIESHLPDMSADDLKQRIKGLRPDCRVVSVSSFEQIKNSPAQLKYGANDYLLNTETLLPLVAAPFEAGENSTDAFAMRGNDALLEVIDVLVGLLEVEDTYFGGMSHRAMTLARQVTEELGAESQTVQEVVLATLLRDVGKVGVAPEVFAEPGQLTEDQKKSMQDHVQASMRLFEHIDFPWKALPIVRHHHERYDGNGYPDGLRGREIPMGARVVAVVDAFVALTSDRTHRDALDAEAALQHMIAQAGRQFDPEVVEAFQKVIDKRFETKRLDTRPVALIADRQKDFRKLLKLRLINEGLEVRETKNCAGALKVMLKNPPDIVIIDMDAEPDEAFGTLAEMRSDKMLCRLPLVFMTRRTDRVQKLRALREGVDDYVNKDEDVETLVARFENILTRESIRRDGAARVRRGISGDLENLSLPDIVQTLAMGMKSAQVTVTSGEDQGTIWFDNGAAVHCTAGKEEGEQAFYKIVSWTQGEFVIEHGVKSKSSTLTGDTMFLLMEAMRLIDENSDASQAAVS
jgi:response regulator RpfG family c-di-GMP phosphodiesterase